MKTLKSSIVQPKITWHQPNENFKHTAELINSINETDLILLPEMWASGFTMKAHEYYKNTDAAIDLMKKWSQEKEACIIGSLITKVKDDYYNRLYVVDEGKVKQTYDKKHLFAFSGEDRFYKAGNQKCIYNYKEWSLCLNVCYDLRFPVWLRNTEDYDVLIFCANWPDKRIEAWDTLLKARSIENQCYVLGANCHGKDIWNNSYAGHSAHYGYDGQQLTYLENQSGVIQFELGKTPLDKFRSDLPFLKDRDAFKI